jgi:hypothetical protein
MEKYLETSNEQILTSTDTQQSDRKLSLIGSSASVDIIRKSLNTLSSTGYNQCLEDLGNLSTDRKPQWEDVLYEMFTDEVFIPICISDKRYSDVILKTFSRLELYQCSTISNKIIDLGRAKDSLRYDSFVGIQTHFKQSLPIDEDRIVRLTDVRYNHDRAEVILRNTDIVYFDISAIRFSDNVGCSTSSPTGMTSEEACQIAKYIGASINLKGVIIGPYDANADKMGITAQNIALIIYYLCEGHLLKLSECHHKQGEQNRAFNTYTVVPDELETEIVFTENTISGRWWIKSTNEDGTDALIPCTKEDYELACHNVISDNLSKAYTLV